MHRNIHWIRIMVFRLENLRGTSAALVPQFVGFSCFPGDRDHDRIWRHCTSDVDGKDRCVLLLRIRHFILRPSSGQWKISRTKSLRLSIVSYFLAKDAVVVIVIKRQLTRDLNLVRRKLKAARLSCFHNLAERGVSNEYLQKDKRWSESVWDWNVS